MANQQVDKLIAELSTIIEQNRQKRQMADATMQGVEQGKQRAAMEQKTTEQLAAARTPVLQRSSDKSKLAHASSYDDTGYSNHQNKSYRQDDGLGTKSPNYRAGGGGDGGFGEAFAKTQQSSGPAGDPDSGYGETAVSPFSMKNSPSPSAASMSPSTTSAGRVKLAEQYNFLKDNDTPAAAMNPTDAGILDEQKKRMTQRLMMGRGETGGPLGGAGQPAPVDPQSAALEQAGNPDLGNFGNITRDTFNGGPPPAPAAAAPQGAPPGGWSQQDYDLLSALSQRYRG